MEVVIVLMIHVVEYVFQTKLNLSVFYVLTRINESKTLTRCISGKCRCKFDGGNDNNQKWNNNKI